jgi:cell division septum initiation protein DivIVA
VAVQREPKLVDVSVESLPQVFRGYDRAATRKLLEELREINWNLLRERADVEQRLHVMEGACSTLSDSERHLNDELTRMKVAHDALGIREHALRSELEAARREVARFENRELLLTNMLESAKRTSERLRADARAEASKALKKAREREAEMLRRANRECERAERERQRLFRLSEDLRDDLSVVVTDVLGRFLEEIAGPTADGATVERSGDRFESRQLRQKPGFAVGDPRPEQEKASEQDTAAPPRPRPDAGEAPTEAAGSNEGLAALSDDLAEAAAVPTGPSSGLRPTELWPESARSETRDANVTGSKSHGRPTAVLAYTARQIAIVAFEGFILVLALILVLVLTSAIRF